VLGTNVQRVMELACHALYVESFQSHQPAIYSKEKSHNEDSDSGTDTELGDLLDENFGMETSEKQTVNLGYTPYIQLLNDLWLQIEKNAPEKLKVTQH